MGIYWFVLVYLFLNKYRKSFGKKCPSIPRVPFSCSSKADYISYRYST